MHPQQCGYIRRKVRRQRRPGLPVESAFVFYSRYVWESVRKYSAIAAYAWSLNRRRKKIQRDPANKTYTDRAQEPVVVGEDEELQMFEINDFSRDAVARAKAKTKAREVHKARIAQEAAAS